VRGLIILAWAARGTWKTGLHHELHAGEAAAGSPPTA
jgi:hypothetical protein